MLTESVGRSGVRRWGLVAAGAAIWWALHHYNLSFWDWVIFDVVGLGPDSQLGESATGDVALPRFTPARHWFALAHRVEPRPMSRYETAIVSPLAINGDAELALRRLSSRVRSDTTIGALSALRELAAIELSGVDVDQLQGPCRRCSHRST